MGMARHLALGAFGEDLATRELERRGYEILARRVRTRRGELDIVARDGETVVFVEVKTRQSAACGTAAEAVTPAKQRKLARLAAHYLASRRWLERPCRFDVVAVAIGGPDPVIDVVRGAFDVASGWS